jgi:hypothetical protein
MAKSIPMALRWSNGKGHKCRITESEPVQTRISFVAVTRSRQRFLLISLPNPRYSATIGISPDRLHLITLQKYLIV